MFGELDASILPKVRTGLPKQASTTPIRFAGFGEVAAAWKFFSARGSQVDKREPCRSYHHLALVVWSLFPCDAVFPSGVIIQAMGKRLVIQMEEFGELFCGYFLNRHKHLAFLSVT